MKIKALRTVAGSYGHLNIGDMAIVKDGLGMELIAAGLVEEVGDEQPEPEKEIVKEPEVKPTVKTVGKIQKVKNG